MKKFVFVFVLGLVFLPITMLAQTTIEFGYDDSGNRNSRCVLTLKSGTKVETDGQDMFVEPIEDQIGLFQARIYPNPTKGLLRIDFPSLGASKANLSLYNPTGNLLIQQVATDIGNEINLYDFPTGFYILKIQIGQVIKEWKIIKE